MTNPEITMKDKKEVLENDRLATYHALAQSSIDDERGGRYAAVRRPATFIGAGPVSYPKLPEDSPSNQMAMMPDEPPLGYSVNDQDPTGEIWEQEASRGDAAAPETVRRKWRRF
jgi:hypothetical protein